MNVVPNPFLDRLFVPVGQKNIGWMTNDARLYKGVFNSVAGESVNLGSITGGTITIDPLVSNFFRCVIDSNITSVAWNGTLPTEYTFTLQTLQGSGGPYTFAHGLTAKTVGALDPGITAGVSLMLAIFQTLDGGSNWVILQAGGGPLS